jgi:hypothetical protein
LHRDASGPAANIGLPNLVLIRTTMEADMDLMATRANPWKLGNRIVGLDPELRRLWVGGQRLHHGLTGVALAATGLTTLALRRSELNRTIAWVLAGGVLIAHDWKDRSAWFRRGPQSN